MNIINYLCTTLSYKTSDNNMLYNSFGFIRLSYMYCKFVRMISFIKIIRSEISIVSYVYLVYDIPSYGSLYVYSHTYC